jgi:hypothetical protein
VLNCIYLLYSSFGVGERVNVGALNSIHLDFLSFEYVDWKTHFLATKTFLVHNIALPSLSRFNDNGSREYKSLKNIQAVNREFHAHLNMLCIILMCTYYAIIFNLYSEHNLIQVLIIVFIGYEIKVAIVNLN